jgi:hypothetical protein
MPDWLPGWGGCGRDNAAQRPSRVPDPIQGRCHNCSMPSNASSPKPTPSMQPSPNQLSDTAAWAAMYCQNSGSRPYATQLGQHSLAWCHCPVRKASARTWRMRTRQTKGSDRLGAPIMVPPSGRLELARNYGRLRRIAPIATAVPVGRPRRGVDRPAWPLTAGETSSP